ncbi:hypothetical protein [Blastopirellula marina]|uniref:Uncharacterized protein n=1 Tax=Blastopirellula marina DSM 3645 TaxID=314230 RepID=A3ZQZ3_9BACT|nr:hypothetical protein [Blastopirellula marina]EAQ81086.1 hypothetical protein DSM3645_20982 [Blastopirellula marina DSM 3645]
MTILQTLGDIQPGVITGLTAMIAGIVGILLLASRRRSLQGTTLIAPWWWVLIAWIAVTGVETWIGLAVSAGSAVPFRDSLRFTAGMTLFCPQMAQLGAKRPQNVAWQWVVVTLWAVLVMPVGEQFASGRGGELVLVGARSWFLFVLIVVGLLNNGPTRFCMTAILLAMAQTLVLAKHLPGIGVGLAAGGATLAILLLLTAIFLTVVDWPPKGPALRPEDRVWLDFRDSFGAFWALRVAERINASATRYQWGLWLTWSGFTQVEFVGVTGEVNDEVNSALRVSLRSLLRRFVSDEWLHQRMPPEKAEDSRKTPPPEAHL